MTPRLVPTPPNPPPAPRRVRLLLDEAELRRGWRLHDSLEIIQRLRAGGARVRIVSRGEAVVE